VYRLATSTWNEKELEAIQTIIDADMYSMGKYVAEYECEFAGTFGTKYAVMVNSGSTANLLMIGSLFFRKENPLKRGDGCQPSWQPSGL
jgi:dTDP-4-amino-4,6-dideoxygalactose transaminase